jgi:hypothetical protein
VARRRALRARQLNAPPSGRRATSRRRRNRSAARAPRKPTRRQRAPLARKSTRAVPGLVETARRRGARCLSPQGEFGVPEDRRNQPGNRSNVTGPRGASSSLTAFRTPFLTASSGRRAGPRARTVPGPPASEPTSVF